MRRLRWARASVRKRWRCAGDRILAVGTRDEIMKLKGPETKIVDLDGHFVMPGFNDAHMHLASAGLEKMNVNMVGVKTLDEFRERLRAKVDSRRARRMGGRRRLGRDSVAGQGSSHALGSR